MSGKVIKLRTGEEKKMYEKINRLAKEAAEIVEGIENKEFKLVGKKEEQSAEEDHDQVDFTPANKKLAIDFSKPIKKRLVIISRAMQDVVRRAEAVAPLDVNVFIAGETGVGKEEIAKLIHKKSGRKKFVALNAATLPETLVESELFGARKGSFTGSKGQKGFFEQADEGTFFLDEISKVGLEV